mgnify:CR=1 FL=1
MNNKSNKVNAAIIIIGNEILSGRTQEENLAYISKWLNSQNLRHKIIGFDYAAPKHGGNGAIYIFLKKF